MMKNIILTFLISVFFTVACKKNEHIQSVVLETAIDISISNAEGMDLLNPQTSGYIKAEDVNIYILKNGIKEKVFKATADFPENFYIFKVEQEINYLKNGTYYLRLFLSETTNAGNISTTYLDIKGHTDTITAYVENKPGSTVVTKVWFNGDLKYEASKSYHTFEIIK